MSLKTVLHGDILGFDADAIVVPQLPGEILSDFTMRVYEAAGFESMRRAYNKAKREADRIKQNRLLQGDKLTEFYEHNIPTIIMTPGFNLKAKYVIHVVMMLPRWREEQDEPDRFEMKNLLYKYYYCALTCASDTLKAKSVLFPLLGTSLLNIPEEFSRAVAERAFSAWYRKRNESNATSGNQDDNTVFTAAHIVIPFGRKTAKAAQPADTSNMLDKFAEFEQRLNEEIKESGKLKIYYCDDVVKSYLASIRNQSKLEDELDLHSGIISKFKNQDLTPKKWRLIALAIGMGLDDYERFKFIRCCGEKYPSDELDFQVENILRREEYKDFATINQKLCDINPEFDLTKPVKNPGKGKKKNAPKNQKDMEK